MNFENPGDSGENKNPKPEEIKKSGIDEVNQLKKEPEKKTEDTKEREINSEGKNVEKQTNTEEARDIEEENKRKIIRNLAEGGVRTIKEVLDGISSPEESIQSPEFQEAAKEGIKTSLENRCFRLAVEVRDKFSVPQKFFYKIAEELIVNRIFFEDIEWIEALESENILPLGVIELMEGKGVGKLIKNEDKLLINVMEFNRRHSIPERVLNLTEIQETIKEKLLKELSYGAFHNYDYSEAEKLLKDKKFFLSSEVKEAVKKGIVECLNKGHFDSALEAQKDFALSEWFHESPEVVKAINNSLTNKEICSTGKTFRNILQMEGIFPLTEDAWQLPEIKSLFDSLFLGGNTGYKNEKETMKFLWRRKKNEIKNKIKKISLAFKKNSKKD